jgi:hypothetical protein
MIPKAKLVAALISILPFLTLGAPAMTLEDFGRMNNDDEAGYLAFLVEASAHMLKVQGQPDQAAKTIAFFKETGPDGGTQKLAACMQSYFAVNHQNAINPNNRRPILQVEDALESTLKGRDILVPAKYLLERGKEFHPIGPPRQHIGGP